MLARMNIGASIPLDQDLLAKIAGRDEAAFAQLLDRHLENIRALAWRVLANHADVDDIAQEVFLKLWKSPQSFKPGKAKFLQILLSAPRPSRFQLMKRRAR